MISSPVTISYEEDSQRLSAQVSEFVGGVLCLRVGALCGEAADLVDDHGGSSWIWIDKQKSIAAI